MNKTNDSRALSVPSGSAGLPRRPGRGWKWLGSSVWEHTPTGLRIHGLGYARPLGEHSRPWPWQTELAAMRQQGWNKKRALMVWALTLLSPNTVHEPQAR